MHAGIQSPRPECRVIKVGQNALKMRVRRAVAQGGLVDLTFQDLRHVGPRDC